eukprot:8814735-Pyramimonas_sp.AAC.1
MAVDILIVELRLVGADGRAVGAGARGGPEGRDCLLRGPCECSHHPPITLHDAILRDTLCDIT